MYRFACHYPLVTYTSQYLLIKYLAKKPFQENDSNNFEKNDLEAGNNFDSEIEPETKPNTETTASLITKAVIENDNQNAQEKSIEKSNIDPNSD